MSQSAQVGFSLTSQDKADFLQLASLAGVVIDEQIQDILLELLALGVPPKDIVTYLRGVAARVSKATDKKQHLA